MKTILLIIVFFLLFSHIYGERNLAAVFDEIIKDIGFDPEVFKNVKKYYIQINGYYLFGGSIDENALVGIGIKKTQNIKNKEKIYHLNITDIFASRSIIIERLVKNFISLEIPSFLRNSYIEYALISGCKIEVGSVVSKYKLQKRDYVATIYVVKKNKVKIVYVPTEEDLIKEIIKELMTNSVKYTNCQRVQLEEYIIPNLAKINYGILSFVSIINFLNKESNYSSDSLVSFEKIIDSKYLIHNESPVTECFEKP